MENFLDVMEKSLDAINKIFGRLGQTLLDIMGIFFGVMENFLDVIETFLDVIEKFLDAVDKQSGRHGNILSGINRLVERSRGEGRFWKLFLDRVESRAAAAAGNYFCAGSKVEGRRPILGIMSFSLE